MSQSERKDSQVKPKKRKKKAHNTDVNAYWSPGEKEKFLRALKQHGFSKNVESLEKISKEIGSKDVKQVAHYMSRLKKKATYSDIHTQERKQAPIDVWLEKAKRNTAQKFDFSSALEKVYDECVQEEFKEIYQFINPLFKNEYPPDMSPDSAEILIRLMTDLADLINKVGINSIMETIKKYQKPNKEADCQKGASSESEHLFYENGFLEDGADITTLNPLKLPPKLLIEICKKVRETLADSNA